MKITKTISSTRKKYNTTRLHYHPAILMVVLPLLAVSIFAINIMIFSDYILFLVMLDVFTLSVALSLLYLTLFKFAMNEGEGAIMNKYGFFAASKYYSDPREPFIHKIGLLGVISSGLLLFLAIIAATPVSITSIIFSLGLGMFPLNCRMLIKMKIWTLPI